MFLYEDPNTVCGICHVKGHDSNLTGNDPFSGFFACITKLREMVHSLTKERDDLTKQLAEKARNG